MTFGSTPWPQVESPSRFRSLAKSPVVASVLLAGVTLALRVPRIGEQGLWFDEAVSLRHAQPPFDLAQSLASDASAPLFDVILFVWAWAFGDSLEAARSLSALASAGTAALLFLFGRSFLDARAGLLAALLFATSRTQIYFGHEARAYALVELLCVASFYGFLRLLESPTRRRAAFSAVTSAALVYTHYVAVFALVAQLAAACLLVPFRSREMRAYVGSQVAAALLFAPCALYLASAWPPPMAGWIAPPTPGDVVYVLKAFAGSSLLLGAYTVLLLALVATRRAEIAAAARRHAVLVVALWAFVPLVLVYAVSLWVVPCFLYRYVLYSSLAILLLLGFALSTLRLSEPARWLVLLLLLLASVWSAASDPIRRPDWRRAAEIVRKEGGDGALTIVTPPYQLLPFAHHYAPEAFREPTPRMIQILASEGVGATTDLAAVVEEVTTRARKLVFVAATDLDPGAPIALDEEMRARGRPAVRSEDLTGIVVRVYDAP